MRSCGCTVVYKKPPKILQTNFYKCFWGNWVLVLRTAALKWPHSRDGCTEFFLLPLTKKLRCPLFNFLCLQNHLIWMFFKQKVIFYFTLLSNVINYAESDCHLSYGQGPLGFKVKALLRFVVLLVYLRSGNQTFMTKQNPCATVYNIPYFVCERSEFKSQVGQILYSGLPSLQNLPK